MTNRALMCLALPVLLACAPGRAQDIPPAVDAGDLDMRASRYAYLPIVADATWTVKRMIVPFRQTAYEDGRDYLFAFLGTAFDIFEKNKWEILKGAYTGSGSPSVAQQYEYFFAEAVVRGILQFAQAIGDNTLSRTYAFIAPFEGEYAITCHLKGDWFIRPRNRVRVFGPAGDMMAPFDESLSSDRDHTFRVHLPAGSYGVKVAVGSGASNMFHSAGSLNQVLFDNPSYVTFTTTVTASQREVQLLPLLGVEGASTVVEVPYQPRQDPNILDGAISYANPRPGQADFSFKRQGWAMAADPAKGFEPGTFIYHHTHLNAFALGDPLWNGSAAYFTLVRAADSVEDFVLTVSNVFDILTPY